MIHHIIILKLKKILHSSLILCAEFKAHELVHLKIVDKYRQNFELRCKDMNIVYTY